MAQNANDRGGVMSLFQPLEEPEKKSISQLLELSKGDLGIPDFQREFVWGRADVSELFESLVGMMAKPKVPWVRVREYTLPISELLAEAEDLKNLSQTPKGVKYAIPGAVKAYVRPGEFNLSALHTKPTRRRNVNEALRLQLITKQQYKALVS